MSWMSVGSSGSAVSWAGSSHIVTVGLRRIDAGCQSPTSTTRKRWSVLDICVLHHRTNADAGGTCEMQGRQGGSRNHGGLVHAV